MPTTPSSGSESNEGNNVNEKKQEEIVQSLALASASRRSAEIHKRNVIEIQEKTLELLKVAKEEKVENDQGGGEKMDIEGEKDEGEKMEVEEKNEEINVKIHELEAKVASAVADVETATNEYVEAKEKEEVFSTHCFFFHV